MMRTRIAILLMGAFALMMLLSVGTRLLVVQGGVDSFQPVRMLIERATPQRVLPFGFGFLVLPGASEFRDPAAVLFDESPNFSVNNSIDTLDGLLVVIVPFVALLIGSSLAPRRNGEALTLLSSPISRLTFYLGHVITLCCILFVLFIAAWLGGGLLLLLAAPNPWDLIRLLTLMLACSALYAAIFGGLGLSLGILFSRPATGLITGLLIIMILVGVMPSLREAWERSYAKNHSNDYATYITGGEIPTDWAWKARVAIRHTPANALRTTLWLIEAYSPVSRQGCLLCGGVMEPGREYSIAREVLALVVAALLSIFGGGVAFRLKELGSA